MSVMQLDFLTGLNERQLEAVNKLDGPLLVLAGAGTGKTKVLISRIANLISHGVSPYSILAVTFTNKAASEMLERLSNIVPVEGVWLGTFHRIALKILRMHGALIDLDSNFIILDSDDQLKLVKNILQEKDLDAKKYEPKVVLSIIQKWKDQALLPEDITSSDLRNDFYHNIFKVYSEYQERLIASNSMDFGDLLLYNIILFKKHQNILESFQDRFKYILVDEYQDTNSVQYLWLRLLASKHRNICCVGDEDQSIYGWRGAEIGNILRFEKDFPGANVIKLEENYRSTNHILKVASEVIGNNSMRMGKILWTSTNTEDKVKLFSTFDDKNEAMKVVAITMRLMRQPAPKFKDYAILVRAGFQTRLFEDELVRNALPYQIIGGFKFYDRKEIRDILAYIRLSFNQNDDLAFERIINLPKRGIGNAALLSIRKEAYSNSISLFKAANHMCDAGQFKGKSLKSLREFLNNIARWGDDFTQVQHYEVIADIITNSGYQQMLEEEKAVDNSSRIENLKELVRASSEFSSIKEFIEHISLVSDVDDLEQSTQNRIYVMSLHAAKGLEFDVVFLPGWEEGIFPHHRSLAENGAAAIEEERRLAYVGITRAKKQLYISYANYRTIYRNAQFSTPSRFIKELPRESLETI